MHIKAPSILWTFTVVALTGAGCSSCLDRSKPQTHAATSNEPPPSGPSSAPEAPRRVRAPAMAGSWYPDDKEQLARLIDKHLADAKPKAEVKGRVMALVSPHAGYAFSGNAAAAGYRLLKGQEITRVVVLAVAHHVPFTGASIAEVTHYETPLGLIPLDHAAVARLRKCRVVGTVESAHTQEHSLEIQLPFLQRVLGSFTLVPLLLGHLEQKDYEELGAALEEIVDAKTLVVASSDFTHRGPSYSYEVPAGPGTVQERLKRLDQGAIDRVLALDWQGLLAYRRRTGTTICGAAPVAQLLELLARQKPRPQAHLESYYNSGDIGGDYTNTVSYVDVAFSGSWPERSKLEEARSAGEKVFPLSREEKKLLLALARRSLDAAVRKGGYDPSVVKSGSFPDSLQRKAGAFVTLKCKMGPEAVCTGHGDDLRGCIGTIIPVDPVMQTVARRAASAALEDTRFPKKVSPAELGKITVEVSVLTPPRPVASPDKIVIGRHGIILQKGMMSATFLPQVAPEQGWDLETTLAHLSRKAGLGPDGWRDGARFSVYEAIVFTEGEPL